MSTLEKENWTTIKRLFKYLYGTKKYAICYQAKLESERKVNVHGFVNSDKAGDIHQRRSTNIYVFKLFNGAISWMSKRQTVVASPTT